MYLIAVCFVAALGGFLFGFDTAVISGTVNLVKAQFMFSAHMEGWFVSSALVGCIIGVIFAGKMSDKFGRRMSLIVSSVLFLLSAMGCAVAMTPSFLITSRLVGGIGIGMASMLSPLYISEFSPPRLRGRMVTLYQFAITIGILCAYFSNALLVYLGEHALQDIAPGFIRWQVVDEVWRAMFGAGAFPAILFLALLFLVPESPRWLIKEGRWEEGKRIMYRIARPEIAEKELDEINRTVRHEKGSIRELLKPGMRVALLIGIVLPFFSQFSGINVIIYYGPKIFNEAGFTLSDALGGQVTIGIVNVLATLIAIWKIDQLGRRPLLLFGISGVVLALTLVGFFFQNNVTQGGILLVFFLLFVAFFAVSFGPVTWVVLSEIFPTHIRGRAMSIGTFAVWGSNAIVGQTFPWLLENLGSAGPFWLYAIICAPAVYFVWKVIPETKGKSLEEIEQYWKTLGERSKA